ncbi:LysM peptidoglycan-binding domain-containing protein [Pseudarthrobacter sp. NPDC058362]|uniref:LysM peptidoglycan-binding domain-containing protein n=1 Tax=Pseudarthrobacter sp. NPDC058362 TaxID=3346458 RepID=UPI003659ED26
MTEPDSKVSLASDVAMSAAILLLGAVLVFSGKATVDRWKLGAGPGRSAVALDTLQWPGEADALGALASAAGAAVMSWWVLSMAWSAAAIILERCGKGRAAAAARRFSPAFMRRLILALLSLQLLSGPAVHAAMAPGPEWMPTRTEVSAPAGTAMSRPEGDPSRLDPQWRPSAPVTGPGLLAPPGIRAGLQADTAPHGRSEEVTVLAGDTLWDIAKRDLGPGASDVDVALHWPRWYQANRSLIGLNPDVLMPGQVLQAPSSR